MKDSTDNPPTAKLSDQQVGILLDELSAGVTQEQPLDEVFRALSEDLAEPSLRAVAKHMAEQLANGADVDTASAAIDEVFPAHMRGALAIGARTGNLSGVLIGLSESEFARSRMKRELRSALAYPMLVLGFTASLLLFLSVTVVPEFVEIYDGFELELPRATVLTLSIAEVLPKLVLAALATCVAVYVIGSSIVRNRFLHWIRTSLPVLGRTWVWSSQHEFATLLSTLSQQKVPLTDALTCVSKSLRDRNLAWATDRVTERCIDGATLSQSLSESIHFDPTLSSLAEWGESNGTLPLAMRHAAETFEQEMVLFTQFLRRVMPPLMLTFVASALFCMVASLLVPLIELINGLT